MQFLIKVIVSGCLIAVVSEIAKRSTLLAALVVSLPLTSILSILWLYRDTQDVRKIRELSDGIFWAVLPSLFFFIVFSFLLKAGVRFSFSLTLACLAMAAAYAVYALALGKIGIKI